MVIAYILIVAVLFAVAVILGFTRNLGKSILRLASVIIAFVLSMVLTIPASNPIISGVASVVMNMTGSEEKFGAFLSSGASSVSLIFDFLTAIIAPFVFLLVFAMINFILWIVFAVVSSKVKFLTNSGVGYRLGSIGVNIAVCFVIVSAISAPIAFISDGVEGVSENIELSNTVTENLNLNNNGFFNVFSFVSKKTVLPSITKVESPKGSTSTVTASIPVFIKVANCLSNIETAKADSFYELSETLAEDPYVDEVLGSIISDIPKYKDEISNIIGGDIIGGENSAVAEKVMDVLARTEDASTSMKLLGNVYTMGSVISSSSGEASSDDIATMFKNLTEKDSEILAELIDPELLAELTDGNQEAIKAYTDIVNKVTSGIAGINTDTSLSEEARSELINSEAKAFNSLISCINTAGDNEELNFTEIIKDVSSSTVLSGVIGDLTENGSKTNPFNITASTDTEAVSNALKESGINENDDFYKSFMALLPMA